jgi:DNA adenine methylase
MATPFLKWPGGKRWLTESSRLPVPQNFKRYVEPFLGGGAVFFHLNPESAFLSDLNEELIQVYCSMRDSPLELRIALEAHQDAHSKDHYYQVRAKKPNSSVERAARMIYLNRTCWNGLYRVNMKGEFNVPIGTKSKIIFDEEDFYSLSKCLSRVDIRASDFEETIDNSEKGDFVFIDPPYTVKHNLNGFVKYNEQIFSWQDQIRLRDAIQRAILRGAAIVSTNADHASVRDLYKGLCDYKRLERFSVLSGRPEHRLRTSEALFVANLD